VSKNKNTTEKRPRRTVWGAVNAFTAFLYSLFINGRIGAIFSSEKLSYKGSVSESILEKNAKEKKNELRSGSVLEKSRVLGAIAQIRAFLASLSLNVYAIFFTVYGLTAVFIYYVTIATNGKNDHGVSTLITAVIIILCSLPALASSRSAVEVISESRALRWTCLSLLGIPEEKMKVRKNYGGVEYMFMASIIAILFGIFSYFLHSSYLPAVFGIVVAACLIFANPESGVVMTVAAAPFLQFSRAAEPIIIIMILVTAASYAVKIIKRRRTVSLSGEAILSFVFCGFILIAGTFSHGGVVTFKDSLVSVIVILGGFFLSYNLVRGEKRLNSFIRILTVSFLALSVAGLWNMFYNGIADGVMYSIREDVSPIFENNIIYIADSAEVFGVLAVLTAPLVFSYAAKCKNAKSFAVVLILMAVTFASTYVYGSYEALVAVVIEFFVFWLLYSHKSLSVLIFAALPVGIVAIAYPYISSWLGIGDFGELLAGILPLGSKEASEHLAAVKSTVDMLLDGNLMGIGAGKHAFDSIYPAYSNVVSEGVATPTSFWLQLVCWSGIGGAITFAVTVLALFRKSVGNLMVSRNKKSRTETLALFCSLFASLVFGSVNCLWSDIRMLYLFWVIAGMLSAYVREQTEEDEREISEFENISHATDVEMRFHK
jgi:hypothetical protein